jgi:hypothetical protein
LTSCRLPRLLLIFHREKKGYLSKKSLQAYAVRISGRRQNYNNGIMIEYEGRNIEITTGIN